jgi:hypothetical protein
LIHSVSFNPRITVSTPSASGYLGQESYLLLVSRELLMLEILGEEEIHRIVKWI